MFMTRIGRRAGSGPGAMQARVSWGPTSGLSFPMRDPWEGTVRRGLVFIVCHESHLGNSSPAGQGRPWGCWLRAWSL